MSNTVPEKSLGRGLDAFHPETKVEDGFVPFVRNWLPSRTDSLVRRKGYQRIGGDMPLRVTNIVRSGATLQLSLPTWIDITTVTPGPIILWARAIRWTTAVDRIGDVTTKAQPLYYPTFTIVGPTTISVVGSNATGATYTFVDSQDQVYDAAAIGVEAFVWGVPSAWSLSETATNRSGWVTSLSPYKTTTSDTLVATTQQGLCRLVSRDAEGALYGLPATTVLPGAQTGGAPQVVGRPLFGAVPVTPPTRGYIVVPSLGTDGRLQVASILYNTGSGTTSYTLTAPGWSASAALSSIVRTGVDQLHIEQATHGALDGDWTVVSVTSTVSTITVEVSNTANAALDAQRSDASGGGWASVPTDLLTTAPGARAMPGDAVLPSAMLDPDWEVLAGTDTTIVVTGVTADPISLTAALPLFLRRSSNVVPFVAITQVVRGDMLSLGSYTRLLHATYVRPDAEAAMSVTGDGFTATITFTAATSLRAGDAVTLWNAGVFTGTWTISEVVSPTIATFDTSILGTAVPGTVLGSTVQFDEAVSFTTADATSVVERWALTTAPDVPQRRIEPALSRRYPLIQGGSTNASLPQTAQLGSSLFVTNYEDAVQKFDGASTYRAGLVRWNPVLGMDVHANSRDLIDNPNPSYAITTDASGTFGTFTTPAEAAAFSTGSRVVVSIGTGLVWRTESTIVQAVDKTTGRVDFQTTLQVTAGGGANTRIWTEHRIRYFTRYIARDRNGQAIPGPALGSQDYEIALGPPCTVSFKLATYAVFDPVAYSAVELELCREEADTAGDFRGAFQRLISLPVSYLFPTNPNTATVSPLALARGFVLYEDSNQLGALSGTDPLLVLSGADNVGARWDGPPRARCAATVAGRLVLGNVRGWPEVYLTFRESPAQSPSLFKSTKVHKTKLIVRHTDVTVGSTISSDILPFEFLNIDAADTTTTANVFVEEDSSNTPTITFATPGTWPANVQAGSWVFIYHARDQSAFAGEGLAFHGWFQVTKRPQANLLTIAFPVQQRIVVLAVDPALDIIGTTTTNALAVGTPVYLATGASVGTTMVKSVQYWAIPTSNASQLKIATTLANAIAGTAVDLTSIDGSGAIIHVGYAYNPIIAATYSVVSSTNGTDVPVPYKPDGAVPTAGRIVGTKRGSEWLTKTSFLIQDVCSQLARAIQSVHANQGQDQDSTTEPNLYRFQNWLSAETGGDVQPFGTIKLRSSVPGSFTIESVGTIDDAGHSLYTLFAGDAKVPMVAFRSSAGDALDVSVADDSIFAVNHGLVTGQKARLSTTGTLPTGLAVDTLYYIIALGPNAFAFATSAANATADVRVPITAQGAGVHKVRVEVGATEALFPSRLVRSFPNYAETFDGPYSASGDDGDSIIDVNPNDGQQIMAIRPFYADSYSSASQQEARLVVFKERDVYMVNVVEREVQQIQTLGHGAPFPRLVMDTKDGLLYGDKDGLYKINRQAQWVFVGQWLGRFFLQDTAMRTVEPDVPTAVHNAPASLVYVALPAVGEATNGLVATYDHTREEGGERGAWSVLDSYDVVAWTVQGDRLFHGDRLGHVYGARQTGDVSDYRDDAAAYTSVVQLRPMDFGAAGTRKAVQRVSIQFRLAETATLDDVQVAMAIDGALSFVPADEVRLSYAAPSTGLSDVTPSNIHTVSFTPPVRKGEYMQVQISITGLDQPLEIVQVVYSVDLLASGKGVLQAAETR